MSFLGEDFSIASYCLIMIGLFIVAIIAVVVKNTNKEEKWKQKDRKYRV